MIIPRSKETTLYLFIMEQKVSLSSTSMRISFQLNDTLEVSVSLRRVLNTGLCALGVFSLAKMLDLEPSIATNKNQRKIQNFLHIPIFS